MTRLLTTGYETGDVEEAGVTVLGANTTFTCVNTNPVPRAGSFCWKIDNPSSTFNVSYKSFLLPAAKTDVWARWAVYVHFTSTITRTVTLAKWMDATANDQLELRWDMDTEAFEVRRGSTSVATGSGTMPADSWHVLEWRIQILTATTGLTEVWLDGNKIVDFSGDTSNTATLNVQSLRLGMNNSSASSGNNFIAFDDIAINDTLGTVNNGRPQDGRVVLLQPTGAGSSAQWVRGGTDTGANWSQVSELPPSLAQYVGSATVGNRDLYAFSDLPGGIAIQAVNVVEAIAYAVNSDAGGGSIAPTIKSGAVTNEATAIGLSTSAAYIQGRWEQNPDGNVAWTPAAVNAIEVGVTVR